MLKAFVRRINGTAYHFTDKIDEIAECVGHEVFAARAGNLQMIPKRKGSPKAHEMSFSFFPLQKGRM